MTCADSLILTVVHAHIHRITALIYVLLHLRAVLRPAANRSRVNLAEHTFLELDTGAQLLVDRGVLATVRNVIVMVGSRGEPIHRVNGI